MPVLCIHKFGNENQPFFCFRLFSLSTCVPTPTRGRSGSNGLSFKSFQFQFLLHFLLAHTFTHPMKPNIIFCFSLSLCLFLPLPLSLSLYLFVSLTLCLCPFPSFFLFFILLALTQSLCKFLSNQYFSFLCILDEQLILTVFTLTSSLFRSVMLIHCFIFNCSK